jgi:hypothetical protein
MCNDSVSCRGYFGSVSCDGYLYIEQLVTYVVIYILKIIQKGRAIQGGKVEPFMQVM